MTEKVVIIGSGQAGIQAALSLRDQGFEASIRIVGEEPDHPYQRPPLSKAYLLGRLDDAGVLLKAPQIYEDYRLDLNLGVRAEAIDRAARTVRLSNGETAAFDHLILATGARNRTLDLPGADLDGVLTLRTLSHAKDLLARLDGVKRAVVVGAGFIGLEFAAVAAAKGIDVVVVEVAARPMARALSVEMSRFFEARHAAWGVRFVYGATISAINGGGGKVVGVELSDGASISADLVLVGIGVVPNTELAVEAGLVIDNGVVVDEQLRTSDPAISAIGDCARHPSRFSAAGPVLVESVQNATDQGRAVAARIAGRPPATYDAAPWFWSDQGDLKLQIAGLGATHDTAVVRGDPATGAFSVFCFKHGRLLAVESVNRGPDHILARRLLAAQTVITPEQAADEGAPLKALLAPPACMPCQIS
jgi:3-phenylpropionate/trans-cinnamate dioxygenase ferredoxin reductase subunit